MLLRDVFVPGAHSNTPHRFSCLGHAATPPTFLRSAPSAGLNERGVSLVVTLVNLLPVDGYSTDSTPPLTAHRAINVTQGHVQVSSAAAKNCTRPW